MPRVAVITTCFGYEQWLPENIASVDAQTYRDFSHMILGTKGLAAQFPDKRYRHFASDSFRGLSSSKNEAIECVDGEYIVNLDADDKMHPQFLEKLIVQAGPKTIVCPGLQEFEQGTNSGWPSGDLLLASFLAANRIFCCSMYPRKAWIDVGGYDPAFDRGFAEDYDLWIRLVKAGCSVTIVPELLFFYRVHSKSVTRTVDQGKWLEYIRKKYAQ